MYTNEIEREKKKLTMDLKLDVVVFSRDILKEKGNEVLYGVILSELCLSSRFFVGYLRSLRVYGIYSSLSHFYKGTQDI